MLLLVLSGGSQALNELKQKLQDLRVRSWDTTSNCNLHRHGFSNWIGDLFDFIVSMDRLLLAYLFVSMIPSIKNMTMFLQEQLLRIDSFSYGVECTWRFLTGKHLQTAMNSSNPQIFGTCNRHGNCTQTNNLPGASYTCKGLSRWNWSIEPSWTIHKTHFWKPSFQYLPASQSMVTVITLCFSTTLHRFFSCVSKAQVAYSDVKHKVTEAGTFQLPKACRLFVQPKTHQGQEPPWQAVGGQKYLGIGFIHVWFACCKGMPKELPFANAGVRFTRNGGKRLPRN